MTSFYRLNARPVALQGRCSRFRKASDMRNSVHTSREVCTREVWNDIPDTTSQRLREWPQTEVRTSWRIHEDWDLRLEANAARFHPARELPAPARIRRHRSPGRDRGTNCRCARAARSGKRDLQ